MPRKAKRSPVPDVPTGQPYGVAQDQRAALAAVPLPTGGRPPQGGPTPLAPPPPGAPGAPGLPPGEPAVIDPMAAALQEAQMAAPPDGGALFAPTQNADVPWQNGLPVGPGAGPEVLQRTRTPRTARQEQLVRNLRAIAEMHDNDPAMLYLVQLAERGGAG